jgi:hypothetical protein
MVAKQGVIDPGDQQLFGKPEPLSLAFLRIDAIAKLEVISLKQESIRISVVDPGASPG